ncbi:MAG: SDR family oxidoreductase [Granulosicoccaceae bacterium]
MSERVLITGANGLIGRQLQRQLAYTSELTVIATDLSAPSFASDHPDLVSDALDVCDTSQIKQLFTKHRPTAVVHLASIVTPGANTTRDQAYQVDVVGTQNIIQACIEHQCKRLVVTSSGAAYGYHADNPLPLKEHHELRGNREFSYAAHKRLVEELLSQARDQHPQLEQVILRVGTVLGESVDNQITALFHKRRLLAVHGHDSPFVFIWDEDLADILSRAVAQSPTGVFNVCGDGWLSIEQLAHLLGKQTLALPAWLLSALLAVGSSLRISRYGPEQLCFLQFRPVLSNDKLKTHFPYTPRHSSKQAFNRWAKHVGLIS